MGLICVDEQPALIGTVAQAALSKCCLENNLCRLAFRLTSYCASKEEPTCHEVAAWRGTSRCGASGPSSDSTCGLRLRCKQQCAAPGVASAVDAHSGASADAVDAEQACNTPLGWCGLPLYTQPHSLLLRGT